MSARIGRTDRIASAQQLTYERSVFINCPFDAEYKAQFEAIIFAVHDCGLTARCALEADDSGQVRFEKIVSIIAHCRFGIHDLSRTELSQDSRLPRFNMPLELGLFLGAKSFGDKRQEGKITLVMDVEKWRYQKFCSDIAGQDIKSHDGKVELAISAVRDWLRAATSSREPATPGGAAIFRRFQLFQQELPDLCVRAKLERETLIFVDYVTLVQGWLAINDWRPAERTS